MLAAAMIPYLSRPLDTTVNMVIIPSDWKKAIEVPIYKGGGHSLVSNCKPVNGQQANGTCYSNISEGNLGYDGLDIPGSTRIPD
jgi:hypothetical protein